MASSHRSLLDLQSGKWLKWDDGQEMRCGREEEGAGRRKVSFLREGRVFEDAFLRLEVNEGG